jgi:hypothetical protein
MRSRQPTVRCGLEFDFLDVVVAADGTHCHWRRLYLVLEGK